MMEVKNKLKNVVVTSVFIGGAIYAGWKALHLLRSYSTVVGDTAGTETGTNGSSSSKLEHYVRIQTNSLTTVENLMSPLRNVIESCLSMDSLKSQLKETNIQSKKILLWEDLKVVSFSRAVTSACAIGILVVIVRIQFSVIAAYLLSEDDKMSKDIQRQYFSEVHQLLQTKISSLALIVKSCSADVLKQYSLKNLITIENVKTIIFKILDQVSTDSNSRVSSLTEQHRPMSSDMNLKKLLMATQDILELEDTQTIIEEVAERVIHEKYRALADAFHSAAQSQSSMPMAKVIPIVSDNADYILQPRNRSSLLQEMTNKNELMTLSRNCYEAFSET